jgi:hypothetical protein
MKYLSRNAIFFGLSILLLTTGCKKDYLDRNDPGTLSWGDIYNTTSDFEAALAGCYQSIQGPATNNIYLGDMTSDNAYLTRYQPSGPLADIDQLIASPTNSILASYWADNYTTIQRVNLLLDKMVGSEVPDQKQKEIAAEAKFLRAYSYFNLVRVFGGVPLYDNYPALNDIYKVPRSSADSVLNFVVTDLLEASKVDSYRTPDELATAGGKATNVAANTLLGKAYLWKRDFANAETTLGNIVNTSGLALIDLNQLYNADNPINKEIIFSINYERTANFSSPFATSIIPYNCPPIYPNTPQVPAGGGAGMIEPYIASKFSPQDKRNQFIDTATFTYTSILDTNIYSRKYYDPATTFNYLSGSNTIILRYADVLLMYAEALNQNGKTAQAYQYVNQVRSRAGIGNLAAGFSKDQMFQALADERQREFLLEGDRWFDLCWRGIAFLKQEMNKYIPNAYLTIYRNKLVVKDYLILFPIPEDQINVKPVLVQNPGY